jgi:uncharacterized protein YecE (DUF72 family)
MARATGRSRDYRWRHFWPVASSRTVKSKAVVPSTNRVMMAFIVVTSRGGCMVGRGRTQTSTVARPTLNPWRASVPLPASPMIGTCGFSYPEWRGRFYPPELPQSGWLGFYAENFPALELDSTFYRPPERAVVAGWADALPETFALAAKVPRVITHEARLGGDEAVGMLHAFAASLAPLGDRLLAVLLQLPPSLSADEGGRRLERLLTDRPAWLPVVVEVRHPSWHEPWLPELLAGLDASLAMVEYPGAPPPVDWAGPISYGRLLGDRAEMPEIGVRRRGLADALDRWAELVLRVADADRPVAVFANNRFEGSGFATAADLAARVGRPVPDPRSLWPAPPLPGLEF